MKAALRLLASVQKGAQYLEAGAPTGIAGLNTHAAPRSALLYIYNNTLDKLKQFPESSVYRQSTEALTKHRLRIIENTKPAGLEEWQSRVQKTIEAHPDAFKKIAASSGSGHDYVWKVVTETLNSSGVSTPSTREGVVTDFGGQERPMKEGPRDASEKANLGDYLAYDPTEEAAKQVTIEPEPSLTAEQIGTIENEIGAGLIEEVIQVAEGEMALAEKMLENKVWEELTEKPAPGQWDYFSRDTHTGGTQAP